MADSTASAVPRKPEEPSRESVLEKMDLYEPYSAGDLAEVFDDVSRWTIQRRLESLHEEGKVHKKKHSSNRVSYWRTG